ncbi:MAG: DUF177 domain-containing protein [Lachnospiraceae bacterium]|nr:DUF177 domain-containing protein [Lachnospiraceae bacterium]
MWINLSKVLSEQHQTVNETVRVEMDRTKNKHGDFLISHKEPVHVVVEHSKGKELRILADTKMTLRLPCDRCLREVDQTLILQAEKYVDLAKSETEQLEELDDSYFIDGYNLDVELLLSAMVLEDWPSKILCQEDCRGICSICGKNQNEGSCDCKDTVGDIRMSMIGDIFQNFKEV